MSELKYWLWLTLLRGVPNSTITTLLDHFGTPEKVFYADSDALSSVSGLKPAECKAVLNKDLQKVYRVIEVCKKKNIKILTFDSEYYPRLLASIYDPPYVLYARCRERIDLNEHVTIAVVGTRRATPYGRDAARVLSQALTESGMTVISGMADGIDSSAAEGALAAGGKTIAVLGSGVDICYPISNRKLMKKIIDNGIVLSEFPPGTPPFKRNFPIRNRIISGLSLGTVVVEAPEKSGSLITARLAGEQNREVFTVPADITRKASVGSNALLQEGAKPVLSAEDVLCEFHDRYGELMEKNRTSLVFVAKGEEKVAIEKKETVTKPKTIPANIQLDETEQAVLKLLSDKPTHIDALAEQGIELPKLTSALTMLEMKGLVRALPGKQYILSSL